MVASEKDKYNVDIMGSIMNNLSTKNVVHFSELKNTDEG